MNAVLVDIVGVIGLAVGRVRVAVPLIGLHAVALVRNIPQRRIVRRGTAI